MFSARSNLSCRAIADVLDGSGIPFEVEHGRKHVFIVFTHGGRAHRVSVAGTPSDQRAHLNARAYVRRLVRPGAASPDKTDAE